MRPATCTMRTSARNPADGDGPDRALGTWQSCLPPSRQVPCQGCQGEGALRVKRERRWFVLERPRRDTNGGSETEVTVTSKLPSKYRKKQGDRKETEKRREGRILWGLRQRLDELSGGCAQRSADDVASVLRHRRGSTTIHQRPGQ